MINLTSKRIFALTGMSGAGKSTVCKCFSDNGFYVIDCDKSARDVVEIGRPALKELREKLSDKIICEDGSLDRRMTAELIFNDEKKRKLFNRIIYPYITYNIVCKIKSSESNKILLDAPTLFEAGLQGMCEKIISVCADPEICVSRIVERDSIPVELARARLNSQHDIDFFKRKSDFCIINNGTQEDLFTKAKKLILDLEVL